MNEKYKGCLLPVIDENLNIFVESSYYDIDDYDPKLITKVEKVDSLVDYFANNIGYNLFYSFSEADYEEDGVISHFHAYSFETVVRELYLHPETFSLSHDDITFYSKQELVYLNRLKRFLNIAELKDVKVYSNEELSNRVKTDKVREIINCKQYNVKYGREIIEGKVKCALGSYISFKFKEQENILISTLTENFIGIVRADRRIMNLDDVTPDMVDYAEMGYATFEEYKEEFVKSLNENSYMINDDMKVVYETYTVIKKIN